MSWQSFLLKMHVRRQFKAKTSEGAPVEHSRAGLDSINRIKPKLPKSLTITPVEQDGLHGEWLQHTGHAEEKVCLYLHGGGYFWGSPVHYRDLTSRLAREFEGRIFAPDYRLAPENPYPAALEDALAAYNYLLQQGIKPENICVAGDSAGGGLALSLLLAIKNRELPMPAAACLISPWTDLTCSGDSMTVNARKDPLFHPNVLMWTSQYYAGEYDKTEPHISPLFGDLTGLPPMLFQVGSTEILLDDTRRAHEKVLHGNGISRLDVWPKMVHVWHLAAYFVPEGKKAIRDMAIFMNSHIG